MGANLPGPIRDVRRYHPCSRFGDVGRPHLAAVPGESVAQALLAEPHLLSDAKGQVDERFLQHRVVGRARTVGQNELEQAFVGTIGAVEAQASGRMPETRLTPCRVALPSEG